MRFEPSLIEGRLIRRYKRFLADIELASGETITAHCANPGAMTTCAVPGSRVWLSISDNPKRKLAHSWELAEVGPDMLSVNTSIANRLVGAALDAGEIEGLNDYETVEREVKCGASRLDFRLSRADRPACWVEVKTVTLRDKAGVCSFPDSVTVRGRRHLEELAELLDSGARAVLLFVCARTNTTSIRPATEIDPGYAETLAKVACKGVEIIALSTRITTSSIELADPIPVSLR